jgi:hypothetical protein
VVAVTAMSTMSVWAGDGHPCVAVVILGVLGVRRVDDLIGGVRPGRGTGHRILL